MKRKSFTLYIPHYDLRTDIRRLEVELVDAAFETFPYSLRDAVAYMARRSGSRKRRVQWIAKVSGSSMRAVNKFVKRESV